MVGAVGGMFSILTGALLDPSGRGRQHRAPILFSIGFAYLLSFAIHHVLAPRFIPIPFEKA